MINRRRFPTALYSALAGILGATVLPNAHALQAPSPEQDTLIHSRMLKPVPNELWLQIAGAHAAETYEIVRGDTLSDVSLRLFGDAKYWPKVWALNHQAITNPHHIQPGNQITFMAGSGSTLPSLMLVRSNEGAANTTAANRTQSGPALTTDSPNYVRSNEWRKLPKQRWENVAIQVPPTVDAQGFDRRSRVLRSTPKGYSLHVFATNKKISPFGEITNARIDSRRMTLGDTLFIEAKEGQNLQIGQNYSIVDKPESLSGKNSDRTGYGYTVVGAVKMTGVKDGVFVGTIIEASSPVERGNLLIPYRPKLPTREPVAAPEAVEAVIVYDQTSSTFLSAQHKVVFLDRGSADGVKPGMVFRTFQTEDPLTKETITDSDFLKEADIQIADVTEKFSTGIVLSSRSVVLEGQTAKLLTDVASMKRDRSTRMLSPSGASSSQDELEALEQLDTSGGLGSDESRELEQLESWNGNTESQGEPLFEGAAPETAIPTFDEASFDDIASDEPAPQAASSETPAELPLDEGFDEFLADPTSDPTPSVGDSGEGELELAPDA